ncbi:hypothetical protein GVN21_05455 [Caulobacter sp. SLTY]|uniref:copper chaperone n=1 Tax=Caulobacter sp. SLTY TaxID=2683262 RepID=UPI0014120041|nr:DUF2182 domain-containing protein [Caulobacter sp. SLTY]NBB14810.1 hypothetical protein [Caulobacter sp. SLTY]
MPPGSWPVVRGVVLVTIGAWVLAVLQDRGLFLPTFCAMTVLTPTAALASLDLAFALNPPGRLAAGWALMLAAMMTPLLVIPLLHVRAGALARRRLQMMAAFLLAYAAVWMAAGAVLLPVAILLRLVTPSPWILLGLIIPPVLIWQASPARQHCLNRRHARPPLPAFGASALVAAIRFGAAQGFWCIGACWGLMLAPLLLPHGHLPIMAAVALWQFAEHLEPPEPPSWRWRWPRTAARSIAWRLRNRRRPAMAP